LTSTTNAASYRLLFVANCQLAQEDTDAAGGRASGAFPILAVAVPYFFRRLLRIGLAAAPGKAPLNGFGQPIASDRLAKAVAYIAIHWQGR